MKSKESEKEGVTSSTTKSLATLRTEITIAASEANPRGESQKSHLSPFLIGDSISGKQIFTTDTYHQPDCLRFSPSNSSELIEVSLSGKFNARVSRPINLFNFGS